ncbi:MAG TPA: hypothetical protein VHK27_12050, partial [Gammaproteobacteria bacterium]|nr:hypothetical protein [Gammaproteobacteria bacterium]
LIPCIQYPCFSFQLMLGILQKQLDVACTHSYEGSLLLASRHHTQEYTTYLPPVQLGEKVVLIWCESLAQ